LRSHRKKDASVKEAKKDDIIRRRKKDGSRSSFTILPTFRKTIDMINLLVRNLYKSMAKRTPPPMLVLHGFKSHRTNDTGTIVEYENNQ
jgi:hypothetical protein